jgi:ABC-type multidrug transport system fused ATPase/permease subunit
LIIFDEATSSLDVETEKAISDSIAALKHDKTIIVIAHRLSTIRDADMIHYVEEGKILASGTLAQIREQIPAFERQALLSGL